MRIANIAYAQSAFGWIYNSAKPFGGLPKPQTPHAVTVMWSAYTDAHTNDFGTHWFWSRQNGTFEAQNYFGCANRNNTGTWYHSLSCAGTDFISADAIVLGRWYRQALRRRELSTGTVYDYFYDLPDTSKVITTTTGTGDAMTVGTGHQLRFGDVTWAIAEGLDGRLDQLKIWEEFLDVPTIVAESRVTWPLEGKHRSKLWACVPDVRRDFMRDVSGRGNHAKIIADTESPSLLTDIEPPYQIAKYRPPYLLRVPAASSGPITYTHTGSGGFAFGGAAPVNKGKTSIGAGGIALAGAAPVLKTKASQPAGGFSWGGSAIVVRERVYVPVGGVVWSGAAANVKGKVQSPAGGLLWAGTAPHSSSGVQSYEHVGAGGFAWGGVADFAHGKLHTPSGGPQWGGAGFMTKDKVFIPTGGFVWGGSAPHVPPGSPPVGGASSRLLIAIGIY